MSSHGGGGIEMQLIEPDQISIVGRDLVSGEIIVSGVFHRSDAREIARTVLACLDSQPGPEDHQLDFGRAFVLGQDSVIAMVRMFRQRTRRIEVVTEDAIRVHSVALAVLDDLLDEVAEERVRNPATRLGMRSRPRIETN